MSQAPLAPTPSTVSPDAMASRLRREAGLPEVVHFRRPEERPFLAVERERVTILIGGLTRAHDSLIREVLRANGYRCERLPTPDVDDCQVGREFGNAGLCSPAYFTIGSLIAYLRRLEAGGRSRAEIIERFLFLTAGSCGPCRFGMYEAEYRHALEQAGFGGFRILLFQQSQGIHADTGEPGLKFTVNLGMGMLNAIHVADAFNDIVCRVRPFEVRTGETDRVADETLTALGDRLRDRRPFEFMEDGPAWLTRPAARWAPARHTLSVLCKVVDHLYGRDYTSTLAAARAAFDGVEVDRTIVKPVVAIVGEFWAQTTEGDGNFGMFRFLEQEGAEVRPEPLSSWIAHLVHFERLRLDARRRGKAPQANRSMLAALQEQLAYRRKRLLLDGSEALWTHLYHRVTRALGDLAPPLARQRDLVRLAGPYFHALARGGESYMEVGKTVHANVHRTCHLVLALKPFGCLPSAQSDGVQPAVASRHRHAVFLSIETAGEGAVNAHSRVQMALGDARARARAEFDAALASTSRRLEDIRAYVDDHPALRHPCAPVPPRPGVAGTAARFVLHVGQLMGPRRQRVSLGSAAT